MDKSFVFSWTMYNSLAVIASALTMMFFPILCPILIIIIQTSLLYKYLGYRSFFWLLNPILVLSTMGLYSISILLGVIVTALCLELVFSITTKRFSGFMWSLIVLGPFSMIAIIFNEKLLLVPSLSWAVVTFCLFTIIWFLESLFLDRFVLGRVEGKLRIDGVLDN